MSEIPPSAPRAPIVLVHGIFGFDRLNLAGYSLAEYFRLIPETLRAAGHTVPPPPSLNPAGTIAQRAGDLKAYLETQPGLATAQVHIVAHSMGGLDARYMISRLGMAGRVLSLTTIGTPHRGSRIADLVIAGSIPGAAEWFAQIGLDVRGIQDLTTAFCADFNLQTPEAQNVQYFSIAGGFEPPRFGFVPIGVLGLTHDLINQQDGENDGLVSVKSAQFGADSAKWNFLAKWNANHFRLINWGTNLGLSSAEYADKTILNNYVDLAARLDP